MSLNEKFLGFAPSIEKESLFFKIGIGVFDSVDVEEEGCNLFDDKLLNMVLLAALLQQSENSEIRIKSSELFFRMGFGMDIGVEFLVTLREDVSFGFGRCGLVS